MELLELARLNIKDTFAEALRNSAQLKLDLAETLVGTASEVVEVCVSSLGSGGKLMFCGNGGSASDCQHLATELLIRFRNSVNRPSFPALALTLDPAALTAGGNDLGFENVFERPLRGIGRRGDVLFGLTTSGRSQNVIRALQAAREMGITTVGLLGSTGIPASDFCDYPMIVPSSETARVQECHIAIGHALIEMIEDRMILILSAHEKS